MFNIKIIRIIFNVLLLTFLTSTTAIADGEAPALYGSWWAILPPLVAIGLALAIKRVIPALFFGLWLGAWLVHDLAPAGLWRGLLETFQVYVRNALANPDHAAIILFSLMIGGMVGIISRNGGLHSFSMNR